MREDLGSRTFADAERWHATNLPPPERHEIDDTDLVRTEAPDNPEQIQRLTESALWIESEWRKS